MITLIAVYFVASLGSGAHGAPMQLWQPPFENITALQHEIAPRWVPGSRARGTFEILYSCTFTLALCVYTAIHLNVPPPEPHFTFLRRKTKWALIALLAPELVLYTAWDQWNQARGYRAQLNGLGEALRDVLVLPAFPAQPHFATRTNPRVGAKLKFRKLTMQDGFYAAMGGYVVNLPDGKGKWRKSTLTVDGAIKLGKLNPSTIAYHQTIEDKSNADILAKILVCFQVSFLVIQSICRKASGYPLTLLEVHTLVHVVCALLMYLLWFYKPLDIHDPVVVEATEDVVSLFKDEIPDKSRYLCSRARNIRTFKGSTSGSFQAGFVLLVLCASYSGIHLSTWNFFFPTDVEKYIWKVSCIIATCGSVAAPGWLWFSAPNSSDFHEVFNSVLQALGEDSRDSRLYHEFLGLIRTLPGTTNGGSWTQGPPIALKAFLGFILLVIRLLSLLLLGLGVLMTPLFLLARAALVVEAFASIRSVPAGVYANVDWAQYIPHI
ncbi:hypothetical protein FN846DRAFT_440923 [Sphaerosporella brunnea]|uniref:Uncharacterized protein n=1 Tax=Sphaerosporella brunnea TaxID=1250544 RepID=A0A5J5F4H7_9PEZI|nr:hypothetical protein FN846DRAFT_440923 [Sphaerosporella brunnea]